MNKIILSVAIFLMRICGRLHFGRWAKVCPYWLMQIGVQPRSKEISSQEAENLLQTIHEDPKSSALCENIIVKPGKYDLLVIIPVYKVEHFLDDCLQSVLLQKSKYSYHIVAVNDGSPDRSGEILKRYEDDERMTVINQENKGLSGARNTALKSIDAKYVTFLDSDDLLAPDAIERLMNTAYEYDADIVEGSYQRRTIGGKLFAGEKSLHEGISSRDSLKGYPWMKVIRAEMFQHIHFPEGYWYEDTIMEMLIIPLARKVALIKDDVYYYTYNTDSISFSSANSPKSIDGIYITRSLLKDALVCGALVAAPEYQYHHFLQQVHNNWRRSLRLGPDVEQAMFVIACDLWNDFFSDNYACKKTHLINVEKALKTRSFKRFRKACFMDF